jgi:hypothetical protein
MAYENASQTFAATSGWSEVIEVDEANTAGALMVESRAAVDTVQQTPNWTASSGGYQALIVHLVIADAAGGGGVARQAYHYRQH